MILGKAMQEDFTETGTPPPLGGAVFKLSRPAAVAEATGMRSSPSKKAMTA